MTTMRDYAAMREACARGDARRVRKLLGQGAELAHREYDHYSPIAIALREGHGAIVELLLGAGAEPTGFFESALEIAEARGFDEVVRKARDGLRGRRSITTTGERMCQAAREGDLVALEKITKAEGDAIDQRDLQGCTALHWAVGGPERGRDSAPDVRTADWLIELGGDMEAVDRRGFRPIHYTIWDGCIWGLRGWWELTRHLIDRGAATDVNIAAAMGEASQMRAYLTRDASLANYLDRTGTRPISCAADFGHTQIVALLLEHGAALNVAEPEMVRGSRALHTSVVHHHVECVRLLLAHGADPSSQVESALPALSWALGQRGLNEGHAEIADLIAGCGGHAGVMHYVNEGMLPFVAELLHANPSVAQGVLGANNYEHDEETAAAMLRLAMKFGADASQIDVRRLCCYRDLARPVRLLFENGFDPNARGTYGETVLHRCSGLTGPAEFDGSPGIAALAIEFGADVNARDEHYHATPLAWAARDGNVEMVELLLGHGAALRLPDDEEWQTPLFWARRKGRAKIAEMLEKPAG